MALTLRSSKGSALTHAEMDANWTYLRDAEVNVLDRGATGDGVADDYAGFLAAKTFANGRKIRVPRGTYRFATLLVFAETDRLYIEEGVTFTGTAPTGGLREYELAQPTATAASVMKIERLWESTATSYTLAGEASIWQGKTHAYFGVSREFGSADGQAAYPCGALFVFANSKSCPGDVVGVISDAVARTSNASVSAANFIARSAAGITTPKLVGLEIDIAPASGVTPDTNSGAIFVNAFNSAIPGPLFQSGSIGGGTFANGFLIGGLATTAAGFAANGAATMDSLINTGAGVYTSAAIKVSNTHTLQLSGTSSTHAKIYNDSSNNVRHVLGSGSLLLRDSTDATTLVTFGSGGTITVPTPANAAVVIGAASAPSGMQNANSGLQVHGTGVNGSILTSRWQNNTAGSAVTFIKSRAATVNASPVIVQNGDQVGTIGFAADDGTDQNSIAALIVVTIDGTPGTDDLPGAIEFKTTPDGSNTSTSRVKIGNQGNVILNNSGSALATNATGGFAYAPTCAGLPTGTPAVLPTGALPFVIDSTNNKLYFYSGGAWRDAGP